MVFVEVPLTPAVRTATGVRGDAERLYGGEESAAWRVGDVVVRISAYDRDPADAEWCHRVAVAARAGGCAEALAPLPLPGRHDGATATRVEGRTVSLWPYVDGVWAPDDPATVTAAARLLAGLHRALARADLPPRPLSCSLETGLDGRAEYSDPALRDPQLDAWLTDFTTHAPLRHALHGDFYHGNVLTARDSPGSVVALLDWDEALIAPPEVDVAGAALEFTEDDGTGMDGVRRFAATYREAGGTAERLDEETLAQLVRHRLRREAVYFDLACARGVRHDTEDLDYHRERMDTFARLRP
ncbi:aminoglycoside phosphotransferase family protein [Streptomyces sp. AJS327]|uniref:phosphotransferase enzyme family protein n=1 Tax=Streptomyces sp. AJS327 TaxID=2545265 RepID=UPI0015DFFCD5|nr:aminoglycoside phosphotransferase family protein [Streptomyces sp. AJS327]MBA0049954.1 aminoglycoside phosphotransferase family protein [Streptomyces sp. AJS327]